MKNHHQQPNEQNDERGIASILITLIMMIVLSIIVLSFATASRREQSQALDNQLSAAAFYAAESGVNDARQVIATILASDPTGGIPPKNNCISNASDKVPDDSRYFNLTNSLDTADNVEYSCLLINPQPQSLTYTPLAAGSHVIPLNSGITSSGPVDFSSITLTWSLPSDVAKALTAPPLTGCPTSAATGPASYTQFFTGASDTAWPADCKFGGLRIDLVPVPTGAFTVGSLMQSTASAFLIPTTSGSGSGTLVDCNVAALAPGNPYPNPCPAATSQGSIVPADCNGTDAGATCSVTVSQMPGAEHYVLRVQWLFDAVNLTITGNDDSLLSSPIFLNGAQVVIDSTGVANQVQRRIQVRYSTASSDSPAVSDALQSTNSICKRFIITPNLGVDGITTENPVPGAPSAFNFGGNITGCGDTGAPGGPGGGETGGLGSTPVGSENPDPSERGDVTFYNDAALGYPVGRVPISCYYNWGDGGPDQPITPIQCESYTSFSQAVAAGANIHHGYCSEPNNGYPADTAPGAVPCDQLPACTPATEGITYPDPPSHSFTVELVITDAVGGTIITQPTLVLPQCF